MKSHSIAAVLATATAAFAGASAHAASSFQYGYELTIDGSGQYGYNAARFGIKNTGNTAISGINITIGDTRFNFDRVADVQANGGFGHTLHGIDEVDHGLRSDFFGVEFDNFGTDMSWSAFVDIDKDPNLSKKSKTPREDARRVMWANPNTDNAQIQVVFSDGHTLVGSLPDNFQQQMFGLLAMSHGGPETHYDVNGHLWSYAQSILAPITEQTGSDLPGDTGKPGNTNGQNNQQIPGPTPVVPTPAAAMTGLALLGGLLVRRNRA